MRLTHAALFVLALTVVLLFSAAGQPATAQGTPPLPGPEHHPSQILLTSPMARGRISEPA